MVGENPDFQHVRYFETPAQNIYSSYIYGNGLYILQITHRTCKKFPGASKNAHADIWLITKKNVVFGLFFSKMSGF